MKGQANSKPITKQKPRILKKVWVQDFLHNLLFVAFCLVVLFVFLLMFIFRFCVLFGFGYVMFTVCFWYYSCGRQIQVGRGHQFWKTTHLLLGRKKQISSVKSLILLCVSECSLLSIEDQKKDEDEKKLPSAGVIKLPTQTSCTFIWKYLKFTIHFGLVSSPKKMGPIFFDP